MAASGYITGFAQRQEAGVYIVYYDGGTQSINVPITPRSIRRFMLMQDDYIQLEFSLADPINIGIGSHVIDPVFGTFYVTTEQQPKYNQRTGGWDYSLRFDADYMRMRNHLHCLVANGKRMETSWSLTDKLMTHAQQIADDANLIFAPNPAASVDPTTGTISYSSEGYAVEVTADNANEIKHIPYNGISLIAALDAIAEAYGCEWWVTNDRVTIGDTTYAHTLHLGKCELDNTPFVFRLGENVESMDIARDQQTFANRIYAYGGTQNVPEDYDKRLVFRADTVTKSNRNVTSVKVTSINNANELMTLDMVSGAGNTAVVAFAFPAAVESGNNYTRYYTHTTAQQSLRGKQTFDFDLGGRLQMDGDWAATDEPNVSLTASIIYGNNQRIDIPVTASPGIGIGVWYFTIDYHREIDLGSEPQLVQIVLTWRIDFAMGSVHTSDEVEVDIDGDATATADASSATKVVQVHYNNADYQGSFSGATSIITFDGTTKPPTGFEGKEYTITPLNLLRIPLSWYTRDYDTGTLRMAGERRIHLPLVDYPNRYVDADNTQGNAAAHSLNLNEASQVVEAAVIFNDVFPKLTLRIKQGSMATTPMQQRVEHSDGSVTYDKWTQYSFKAEYLHNGTWSDFNFRVAYMLDGAKLQAVFSAPSNAQSSGYLLSGMAFDLGFDERVFKVIRNEDYGIMLPNDTLKPSEGDEFVLTGWNPRAMNDLGIVDAAEEELATKAEEYVAALKEGLFTFTCRMMSNIFWSYNYGGRDNPKTYGLLALGAKVTISGAAMPDKTSRIIGYEYKLDIPYDTPTYIVGETEAYSRLKRIEKQLTKL